MVQILIKGGLKRQRVQVTKAVTWSASELMHKRMTDNLEINITLMSLKGMAGYCIWADNNYMPREFDIELEKNQTDEELIISVFHEMTHVKQYAKNETKERWYPRKLGHRVHWKDDDRNWDLAPYIDKPWEIEAYHLQEVLYDRWKEQLT